MAAVMASTMNDSSRIWNAGVETGAKMLGVSIVTIGQGQRARSGPYPKRAVLLTGGIPFASFSRRVAKNAAGLDAHERRFRPRRGRPPSRLARSSSSSRLRFQMASILGSSFSGAQRREGVDAGG